MKGVDYDLNAWINTYPNLHFDQTQNVFYLKVLLTFLENYNVEIYIFSETEKMKRIHICVHIVYTYNTRHQTTLKWRGKKMH